MLTTALLTLGALLSLAYALWAFTARRGIFQDFADGISVSVDDAKSSDLIDTILLFMAGLVAVIALGLWLSRMLTKKTGRGWIDKAGLVLALFGGTAVIVGLFLTNGVTGADGKVSQGESGVTATLVVGSGFALLAIGLLMGIFAVRGRRDAADDSPGAVPATGYGGW